MNIEKFDLLNQNEVEVTIASAGSRMAAYLINIIFGVIALSPFFIVVKSLEVKTGGFKQMAALEGFWQDMGWLMLLGLLVVVLYGIVQIYFMSRDGQSLGKKIMGIRVLKTDGRNPGFVGAVLMREVLYNLIVVLVAVAIGKLGQLATGSENVGVKMEQIVSWGAFIVCVVMLFQTKIDRRTLSDYLADTVVVELPKRQR